MFESQGFPRECKKCLEVIDVTYWLRNIFLCKPNFFLTLINKRYFNIWNIAFATVVFFLFFFFGDTFERWSLLNDRYVRVRVIKSHLQLHFVNKIFVLSSDLEGLENPIPYSNLLIDSRISSVNSRKSRFHEKKKEAVFLRKTFTYFYWCSFLVKFWWIIVYKLTFPHLSPPYFENHGTRPRIVPKWKTWNY